MSRLSIRTRRAAARAGVAAVTLAAAGVLGMPAASALTPTISVVPTPGTFVAGDVISATASIDDAKDAKVTLTVFSGADCATALKTSDEVTLANNDPYTYKFSLRTNDAGVYSFRANLTNPSAQSTCTPPVTVAKATPTVSTVATNAKTGESVHNTATLAGRVTPESNEAGRTITFGLYSPGDATCTGTPVGTDTKTVGISQNSYVSRNIAVAGAGAYRWKVVYSGDKNNNAVIVGCGVGTSTVTAESTPPPPAPTPTCDGVPATIVGNNSANTITGTGGNDVIVGRGGNDKIDGRGGNDLICGDGGSDTIVGGTGADEIRGGSGNDKLTGSSGNDYLIGEGGDDTLTAGKGDDRLNGGTGRDTLDGGAGKDVGNGGSGKDAFIDVERRTG